MNGTKKASLTFGKKRLATSTKKLSGWNCISMTKPEISVHRCRKCRFDFENEEKIVGDGRGKLAKSRGRNQSSPICLPWPYHLVNPLVTRHPHRIAAVVSRLRRRIAELYAELYIHSRIRVVEKQNADRWYRAPYIFVARINISSILPLLPQGCARQCLSFSELNFCRTKSSLKVDYTRLFLYLCIFIKTLLFSYFKYLIPLISNIWLTPSR